MIALALFLAASARAAAPAAKPGQPYWTKVYSTAPYKEFWTGALALKDFDKGLPKALAAIAKNGGTMTQPVANFVSSPKERSQQLSFSIPRKNGPALLKALRKLGDIADPAVRGDGEPIPLDEVRAKIDAIQKEKNERAAELSRAPAAAAAQDEVLAHLLLVEGVAKRADTQALFNLQVTQK